MVRNSENAPFERGPLLDAVMQIQSELVAFAQATLKLGGDDAADVLQRVRINAARLDAHGFIANDTRRLLFSLMRKYAWTISRARLGRKRLAEALYASIAADGEVASRRDLWPLMLALAELSVLLRDVVIVHSVLDLNYKEAEGVLRVPSATLRQRYVRATRQLRQILVRAPTATTATREREREREREEGETEGLGARSLTCTIPHRAGDGIEAAVSLRLLR
jgi:DNA-directed RNA polymerase specialized sigma24 family protein